LPPLDLENAPAYLSLDYSGRHEHVHVGFVSGIHASKDLYNQEKGMQVLIDFSLKRQKYGYKTQTLSSHVIKMTNN